MHEEIKKYRKYCLKILKIFPYIKINNESMFLEEEKGEVFLGINTSGLGQSRKKDYILEIYALKRSINGEIIGSFHTYIKDSRLKEISKEAENINKITMNTIKNAPSIFQVISNLKMFLQDDIVIAHNIDFTWNKFIQRDFCDFGIYCNNITICTLRLSKKIMEGLFSYKLDELTEYLNITFDKTISSGLINNVAKVIGIYEAMKEHDFNNDTGDEKKNLFDEYYNCKLEEYKKFPSNYEFEEFSLVGIDTKRNMATINIEKALYDLCFSRNICQWDLKNLKEINKEKSKEIKIHNIDIVKLNQLVKHERLKGA